MGRGTRTAVLVPGAGGAAAVGAIKGLRMAGHRARIVATDPDPLSPGLALADRGVVTPPAADSHFFIRAMALIRQERIGTILPTSGFDIVEYARQREVLDRLGVVFVGCDLDVMETCIDKWRFHTRFAGRFPLPRTVLAADAAHAKVPCFVKPVRGKGGREATFCGDRTALAERLRGRSDLVQEYLPGAEYSVDVLADLTGRPLVAVPRERLRVLEGISVRGRVVHDPEIERLCLDLAAELGVKGPVCMQVKRDAAGRPRFVEVNPRMGGGTLFSAFAGVNIAACCLDLAAGRPLPPLRFAEITIVRYFEEMVWDVARAGQGGSRPSHGAAPPVR